MNIGGCQLLIKKLANEIISRGDKVFIYCESITQELSINREKINIVQVGHKKWGNDKELRNFLKIFGSDSIRNITFLWTDYAWVYSCVEASNLVLFYVVHHDALKMAAYSTKLAVEKIRKGYLASVLFRLIRNNAVVMMDEQTVKHTLSYYGFTDVKPKIIRIPISFEHKDLNLEDIAKKYGQKHKIILAVARADFPFKGYLIGLLKLMKNHLIPEEFSLNIVSYGSDYDELNAAYEQCPDDIKKRIKLYGETPYEELIGLFEKAHVYVGMGTTLLDASKYGVISIPVVSYSYQVKCMHFFHDNYNVLALDDGTEQRFLELLEEINLLNEDSSLPILRDCERSVRNIYGVGKCVDEICDTFYKIKDNKIKKIILYHKLQLITDKLRERLH